MATLPNSSAHGVDNLYEGNTGKGVTIYGMRAGIHPSLAADGVTDDGPALAALSTGNYSGGDVFELAPTTHTYYINSTQTISCHLRPLKGAVLELGPSANLTIAGPFDPQMYKVFKFSGGLLSFTSKHIKEFYPQWWGVVGDGVADDAPALLLMTNSIPDRSAVYFSPQLKMKLSSMWPVIGRSNLRFFTTLWPHDAYGTDNAATFTWAGVSGGTMIGSYNNGFVVWEGFLFDMQTASVAIDQDKIQIGSTSGSTAFTSNNMPAGTAGAGPSFLTSLAANIPIKLSSAGPGVTVLSTTIASVTDGTHAALAVTASTSSQFNSFSLGANAPTPVTRISTQNEYSRNRFVGGIGTTTTVCVQIAKTSGDNCEYNIINRNWFCGNGSTVPTYAIPQNSGNQGRALFNSPVGWSAPTGFINAGTNAFGGFSVDTFTAGMNGARIRIAKCGATGTGPGGGNAALDGFMKFVDARNCTVFSNAGLTVPLNATNNSGAAPNFLIGTALGIGVYIGPHQNAKAQVFNHNNQFIALNIGTDCEGGSMHHVFSNFVDCEVNVWMGNSQSEPSSERGSNSENSRQHLFFQSGMPYEIGVSRYAMLFISPGAGYLKFAGGNGPFSMRTTQIENAVPSGAAVYDLLSAAGQIVDSRANRFADAASLTEIGWNQAALPNNTVVYTTGDQAINGGFLPYQATYVSANGVTTGVPTPTRIGGTVFLRGPNQSNIPADGVFGPQEMAFYFDNDGVLARAQLADTTMHSYRIPVAGHVDLTDAATVAVDLSRGDFYVLVAAAGRTIGNPTNPTKGQFVDFHIFNNSGGAMVTTWSGSYHLSSAWVDPANGKARSIRFRNISGVLYEHSRGVGDIP